MNDRERLLTILDRQPPDRIPWIPRLLLWYNARKLTQTMPAEFEGLSLRELEKRLGVGTPARDGRICSVVRDGVEVITRDEGGKRITEYHTPVGTVREVMHFSADLDAQGLPGRVEEFLLKEPRDYKIWEWVVEHTRWAPAYDAYRAYDAETGEGGLPMISTGDVPLHGWAQALAGYEYAYFHLADFPEMVDHLLHTMWEVERERLWPVVAESPARLILHGVHLSSQFTPPSLFRKYITPYCQEFIPMMHEHGKAVAMHGDNDVSQIIELLEQAGWDMVECFVTAPMVPLTLRRAREVWGNRMIMWGGLPSLLLSPSVAEDEFRAYLDELLDIIAPGDAFILGVADNVMPDSLISRVAYVTDLIEKRGWYPIE